MAKIYIIDDEAAILDLMSKLCRNAGHEVEAFQTGTSAIAALRQSAPDLVIVDLHIGDINGLELIQHCREQHPDTAVIMVTGHGSVETAVEAMRLGAFDYLTKPFDLSDLLKAVNQSLGQNPQSTPAKATSEATAQNKALAHATLPRRSPGSKLIGHSPALQRIIEITRRVADSDSPVLLEGEFGVGKHVIARSIHNQSQRSNAPFKELQCSSLPEPVMETELFGHNGNPLTGIFGRTSGGTIHLAEIDLLPPRLQAQLNTFLEEWQTRKGPWSAGGGMDFRLITSTTLSLEAATNNHAFREDLFYKISVVPIQIPPLRDRKEDIQPLTEHFLKELAERSTPGAPPKTISQNAIDFLTHYTWPGNISELRNAVERACAFADQQIEPTDLPSKVSQQLQVPTPEGDGQMQSLPIGTSLDDFIKAQERLFIQETLKYNNGSREKTASMLGVSIATLYRKMDLNSERKTTA
jgi:DNA-binding NtrC family response regulator